MLYLHCGPFQETFEVASKNMYNITEWKLFKGDIGWITQIGSCLFLSSLPSFLMESLKLYFTEHLPYVRHFIKTVTIHKTTFV